MNRDTLITTVTSIVVILMLIAVVFALRAPAADLNLIPNDMKADYTDENGLPYFSEMDSYYNLRLTEDYIDHGFVGDEMVNGSEWDNHRYAPTGNQINYELGIVYVTSFIHDFANQYLGDYSVREVAFWTGAIIASLAVIPAFIFARRLTNTTGAIVATLIIVLAPNYFSHTFAGFFDTDMFYYIFSLFFIFFFVEAIRAKNIIWKVVFAILSIISIGLFSQSWTGYIFYIGLMGLFSVAYLIVCYFFNIGDDNPNEYPSKFQWFIHQKELLAIIILAVIGFIGLGVFKGVDGVLSIFGELLKLLSLQSLSRSASGFPNVLISVAEMQVPNMLGGGMNSIFLASTNGAINGIGGILVLFSGLTVLYILGSRAWKYRTVKSEIQTDKKPQKGKRLSSAKKIDDKNKFKLSLADAKFNSGLEILDDKRLTILYAVLFIVWVVGTALAVTRGSRFITTIVLPFGLMAGIFVGFASEYIKNKLNDDRWLAVIVFMTAVFIAVPISSIEFGSKHPFTIWGIVAFLIVIAVGLVSIYGVKSNPTPRKKSLKKQDDSSGNLVKKASGIFEGLSGRFGSSGGDAYNTASDSKRTYSKSVPIKKYVVIALIVFALITPSICGAYSTTNNVVPGTSDAMWKSMEWVDLNMPEDTVITSWWDFGYLFEIAADRQVTFDGGSQSGDRAFWLGQAMSTDDLELSAGIFRMLDTSGTKAEDALINYTGDAGNATSALIDILPQTPDDAKSTLMSKYHLTSAQANEVVNYTHPENPRPVIFVASSDMLQKAGWWSYFGAWDFENQTSENYQYYIPTSTVKVEPGQTGKLALINDSGMVVNAVIVRGTGNNTTTGYSEALYAENGKQIYINDTAYNPLNISNIIVIEDGYLMKNESVGDVENANYTLFLIGQDNEYTPILIHNKLTNSMFTRLYLLGGAGQDIFTNVHNENGVMLWEVNFNNTVAGGA